MNQSTEPVLPLALRPRDAAKALGISARLLWQLTKDGQIPCVRVGSGSRKTVLYPLVELQAWLSREATPVKSGEQPRDRELLKSGVEGGHVLAEWPVSGYHQHTNP